MIGGSGQRYKTVDSTAGTNVYTYYITPLMELRNHSTSSAGTLVYNIFAGSQRVATLSDGLYSYVLQDHLGGTALITDESGTVTEVYDYYPYGAELIADQLGTTETAHTFTDKEFSEELGLYYFEARWYNPSIGRFASLDPMDGISYAYANNNPLIFIDPTGLYNVETGDLEEGDTKDDIVQQVNDAYGIETTWDDIATASYLDPERSIEDLLSTDDPNDKFLAVGTAHTKDITDILDTLNQGVADAGLSVWQLINYAKNGGQGDLKSWGEDSFGGKYWSYIYHGRIIRQDAPGNIHLGYEAGAYGVPMWVRDAFGATTQANHSWIPNILTGDNPYDKTMVEMGYEMATSP